MKIRAATLFSFLLSAGFAMATLTAPPFPVMDTGSPGVDQNFDAFDPPDWGYNRAIIGLPGGATFSGGQMIVEGTYPGGTGARTVLRVTNYVEPGVPDTGGADDAAMPTSGWVFRYAFDVTYTFTGDQGDGETDLLTMVSIEGGAKDFRLFGPASAGPASYSVNLRDVETLASGALPAGPHVFTVRYNGDTAGTVDVWMDSAQIVNDYDIHAQSPTTGWAATQAQIMGGSATWVGVVASDELQWGLIPEPATGMLILLGGALLGTVRRTRR